MYHYYYTVASKEYTYKIMLLYNSMIKHDNFFKFFIVCMDSDSKEMFGKLGLLNAVLIDIKALEANDIELALVKERRSTKQYAWAAKPIAAIYILENYNEVDHIIWLDGDTLFLSSPEPIFEEWGGYPVALTEEKFTGKYEHTADIYGYYNTGFMGFKRSEAAFACLRYFREKLLIWNYDEKEQYRWNDQLYVSDWPQRFGNIGIIKNHGVNMTPFIFNRLLEENNYSLVEREGCLYMGDIKITLFHFYGFTYFNRHEFELCSYTDIYNQSEINRLYLPYIKDGIRMIDIIGTIDRKYYTKQQTGQKNIRNHFCLDMSGHLSRVKGKGIRGKSLYDMKNEADSQMKKGNRGE